MTDHVAPSQVAARLDRLRHLLDPASTAVLTMEMQQGIVGPGGVFPALVDQVESVGLVDAVARLCRGARAAGSRVVHCTMVARSDGAGQALNCKVFALNERLRVQRGAAPNELGTPGADVVAALLDPASDLEVSRLHGMTPFMSTALDQVLRNLGVTTVVATGVSVNLGVMGMVLSAVDLGYQVVLPRDAVTGVPQAYADAVIEHSLSMVTTVTTTAEVLDVWLPR